MVKRILIILSLLATAVYAAEKKYYEYPDITTLPDASRMLIYDGSASKNITGSALKALFPNRSSANQISGLSPVATTGAYSDLTGQPTISAPGVGLAHFNIYSANRAAEENAELKITYDQFMALNGAALPSETNPLATLHDITAAGYTSNYIFCEDVMFAGTTPLWHELERQSDGGAIGTHTATGTAYSEMDRYVTSALNTNIIPGGTWKFTLYAKLNAVQKEGTLKADIYRVNSAGAIVGTVLATATSATFINTTVVPLQMSAYLAQQTGWDTTDRIGVVISGKRGAEGGATVTWYHDAASGYASIMESPVVLLHNQMQGLNEGDYKHLTGTEKTGVDGLLDGIAATDISYTNPTYTTVAAALDQLLYVAPGSPSVSGGGTYEIGSTITSVPLTWSITLGNKSLTSQSINNSIGEIDTALRVYTHSGQSITANRTYTVSITDGTTPRTGSTTVSFSPRRYWAPTTIPLASLTSANIIALAGSDYSSSHSKSGVTYNCTGGQYPTFAFVATGGTLTATTVGGLSFTDYSYRTVSVTNASGYTQNYYVYQFNSLQSGSAISVNWD